MLFLFSQKKMKFSILTGSFGFDGINEFLRDLSYGKGRTNPVRGNLFFFTISDRYFIRSKFCAEIKNISIVAIF